MSFEFISLLANLRSLHKRAKQINKIIKHDALSTSKLYDMIDVLNIEISRLKINLINNFVEDSEVMYMISQVENAIASLPTSNDMISMMAPDVVKHCNECL